MQSSSCLCRSLQQHPLLRMAVLCCQFCTFNHQRLHPDSDTRESAQFTVGPLLAKHAGSRMYAEGMRTLTYDLKLSWQLCRMKSVSCINMEVASNVLETLYRHRHKTHNSYFSFCSCICCSCLYCLCVSCSSVLYYCVLL
jgi:hypothetical protein